MFEVIIMNARQKWFQAGDWKRGFFAKLTAYIDNESAGWPALIMLRARSKLSTQIMYKNNFEVQFTYVSSITLLYFYI
jgi:hypothetical protein